MGDLLERLNRAMNAPESLNPTERWEVRTICESLIRTMVDCDLHDARMSEPHEWHEWTDRMRLDLAWGPSVQRVTGTEVPA